MKRAIILGLIAGVSNFKTAAKPLTHVNDTGEIGSVHYHRFSRLNNPVTKSRDQDWLGLSIDSDWQLARFKQLKLDTDIRFYLDSQDLNYSLQEGYWKFEDSKNRLVIGRQILDWNPGEGYWTQNGLNARQGFTLLDQEQEGLLGLSFSHQMGDFGAEIYFSYLHIPQVNPGISIDDGKVESRSEWVKLPPTRTTFKGVELDIVYRINDPKILKDFVFKKSLGGSLNYEWGSGRILGFAIYKPENSIRANAFVEEIDSVNNTVTVVAEPIVNHHVVLGGHIEQKYAGLKWLLGFDVIDPNARLGSDFEAFDPIELKNERRVFRSDEFVIEPSYDRESYVRALVQKQWDTTTITLHYINEMSDFPRGDDFFTDTVRWENAVGFHMDHKFSDKLTGLIDLKYDLERKDNILRSEFSYRFNRQFNFILGVELLKAPSRSSFWAAYRANDTAYGQLSFHF